MTWIWGGLPLALGCSQPALPCGYRGPIQRVLPQPAQGNLEDPKYGNKGKFVEVLMDGRVAMGLKKVTYTFDKWFEAIHCRPKGILPSSQLSRPMFVGLEMKRDCRRSGLAKVNPDKIRNNPSNSYLNHGDPEGKQYSVGEADVSCPAGSTMTIRA